MTQTIDAPNHFSDGRDSSRRTKTVVVTGASAGVGRATAHAFAKRGDRVALLSRGRAGLEGAAREVTEMGGKALVIPTDVADHDAVESAAEQVENELGPIDIWVNNAMASVFSPVKQMKPEEYRRVTEVTYLGTVYGTLAALSRMERHGGGHIIQIGSALAYRGIPLQSAYCGAKHAIQGFCDSLRAELLHDQSPVKLTMIQLPAVNTPQFDWVKSRLANRAQPVPPIYQPEVIADAVVWCSERDKRELLLGAPSAITVWGNKALPGVGDRYLAATGFKSQQTDVPEDPDRPSNLWEPVDDEVDHGTHGRFDERAFGTSPLFFAEKHHLTALAAGAALAGAVGLGWLLARRD